MKAARVRIGRVTLKGGGADLRVLTPDRTPSEVLQHMRTWVDLCARNPDGPPDGFVAVSFRIQPEVPQHPATRTGFFSAHPSLPTWLLPDLARQILLVDMQCDVSERNIMGLLGYEPDDGT